MIPEQMMAKRQVYFFRSKITLRTYQNDLRQVSSFDQVSEICLFFFYAMRNKLL